MKPVLYEQNETTFTSQGIGVLSDALKCIVTEELNNVYDLEMTYPVDGVHYKELTLRRIIKAKPNQTDNPQPFRIYKITKPMSGSVTVLAHHLTYDLSGVVVPPFTVNTPGGVIASITGTALPTIQPFSFTNTVTGNEDYVSDKPVSVRAILSGFLNVYGGELSYNVGNVIIAPRRGSDKGAVISYGKNLLDLKQEENCADVCTGVFPYYHTEQGHVELTEKVINLPGTFDFQKIVPLDLTPSFPDQETIPTETQLRAAANQYIANNNLGVPTVSLTVNYVSIEDSEEAIPLHMFEGIALGDDVTVRFEKMDINVKSRCIKYVYDAVVERVQSVDIGDKTTTFTDTMAKQYTAVESGEYEAVIMDALARATQAITNGLGGYVMLHKSNPTLDTPDELLILGDSPDLEQATQVWRWNRYGLAYSDDGYTPTAPHTYKTAMTADGQIVADMITTGILRAIEISCYKTVDGQQVQTFHVTSQGEMTATWGSIGGFTIDTNRIYNDCVQIDNSGGYAIVNGGSVIGRIRRTVQSDGTNGLAVILGTGGETISWNEEKSDGTYDTILAYDRTTQKLNIYRDLYCSYHNIYGVSGISPRNDESYARYYLVFSQVSIDPGDPGYITIKNYTAQFNGYGQYMSQSLTSQATYECPHIAVY